MSFDKVDNDNMTKNKSQINTFDEPLQNEKATLYELGFVREKLPTMEFMSKVVDKWAPERSQKRVFYISDIHLLHKFEINNCKTEDDKKSIVHDIVTAILSKSHDILVIVGDISSDFYWYKYFFRSMVAYLNFTWKNDWLTFTHRQIIVIPGNHDLWSFSNTPLGEIFDRYRLLFNKCNEITDKIGVRFTFLQNALYYEQREYVLSTSQMPFINNDENEPHMAWKIIPYVIEESELEAISSVQLQDRLKKADFVLLGGMGFSGCNQSFNADQGIYCDLLSRKEEIEKSKQFEAIYDKVTENCHRPLVIASHMPICDWKENYNYQDGNVYLSGHNHRNCFYDDNTTRYYADNQIGYYSNSIQTKWFDIQGNYNIFAEYKDGIHEITKDEYNEFCHGINLGSKGLSATLEFATIYLLKKSGYYCFIAKNKNKKGSLLILNGGAMKKLPINDIQYYFGYMDQMIESLNEPLTKYMALQEKVSDDVRAFGGDGKIHGCIIDIDFFNHIYLNPYDSSLTPYWAENIINKRVYQNVPSLLKAELPQLFDKYMSLLSSGEDTALSVIKDEAIIAKATKYHGTDIYRESRIIRKMQKLNNNLLVIWEDAALRKTNLLIEDKYALSYSVRQGTLKYVGQKIMQKCNMLAEVIKYRRWDDIDVQFEDGTIVEHTSIEKWRLGRITTLKK